MKTTLRNPALRVVSLLAVSLLLGGCGGQRIKGRVVEGSIGVVTVVESKDDRLDGPGVANVALELRASNQTRSKSLAEGRSGADGSFSFPLSSGQSLSDQLLLTARADGYVATQGVTFIPGEGRELLVVLKRSDGQTPPAGTPDGQKPAPTPAR